MKLSTFILSFLVCIGLNAQNKLGLADKYYNDYAYFKALDLYKSTLKKGDSSAYTLERIGNCYYNNSMTKDATFWYEKALRKQKKDNPKLLYKQIQSLRSLGKYDEAYKLLLDYKAVKNEKIKDENFESNYIKLFEDLNRPKNKFTKVINLPVNTSYSEFGGHLNIDEIYFSSTKIDSSLSDSKKIYLWNNEPFLNIYLSKFKFTVDSINANHAIKLNNTDLNTRVHEANVVITKDGTTMYFTRDNVKRRSKLNPDKTGTVQLELYRAFLINNKWQNMEELPFNGEGFSVGHPALSTDEKTLYFVSDQPGGIGATDIYKVAINEDGSFGLPENLGKEINTEAREMFPYISEDETLYFSSDGYINLGLLDIYKSNILTKKENESVITTNLGAPYNSGFDDFSFTIDSKNLRGFFSSDRPGGKGSDDIYAFLNLDCEQTINGTISDELTKLPLANATVRLIDDEGKIINSTKTDQKGYYEFLNVECDKEVVIVSHKVDYKPNKVDIKTNIKNEDITTVNLELTPLIIEGEIVINPIFFDFDKDNIRIDAAYELENIVNVLKTHPNMVIKIESHTDSRGRDKYNMKLSNRRAKSTMQYILSRDISKNQIESAIGYGESQLLNKCSNKVKCTEEEHQLNRRSKFLIIKK